MLDAANDRPAPDTSSSERSDLPPSIGASTRAQAGGVEQAVHACDADCAPHLVDDECTVCGVVHGEPCGGIFERRGGVWVVAIEGCGGRGYHKDGCRVAEVG